MRQLYVAIDLPHRVSEQDLIRAANQLATQVHGRVEAARLICEVERPTLWTRIVNALTQSKAHDFKDLLPS